MADDLILNPGAGGDTIAADDILGVKYQRVKISVGADGSAADNSTAAPLAVKISDGTDVALVDGSGNLNTVVNGTVDVTGSVDVSGSTVTVVHSGLTELAAAINGNVLDVNIAAYVSDFSVTGEVDHDSADANPPVKIGGFAKATAPTAVSADGDRVNAWFDLNGRLQVGDGGGNLSIDDGGGAITVDNGGTFVTQENGAALTALQLIDDIVYTDDTSTHSTGTSKGALFMAAATPTDTAVNANDIGAVAMTTDRKLHVSVRDSLPAGTAAIGKLAANSGVDIGDVDVTSIAAGTNLIGDVGIQPRTTNGLTTFMASGSDGSSILVATAQVIKASAGKLYGYYAYNPEAAVTFVHFYNTAAASVTVGTTNPLFTLAIPPGSAANLFSDIGITFSNAGWSCAATTTAGGNTAPATGVSLVAWYA